MFVCFKLNILLVEKLIFVCFREVALPSTGKGGFPTSGSVSSRCQERCLPCIGQIRFPVLFDDRTVVVATAATVADMYVDGCLAGLFQ